MCPESTFIFLCENVETFHNVSSRISKPIYWAGKLQGKIFGSYVDYGTGSMILSYDFIHAQLCPLLLTILNASQLIWATKSFQDSTSQSVLYGTVAFGKC